MTETPEEIIAAEGAESGNRRGRSFSTEDIADAEEARSESDANDDNDAREEKIESDNDTLDSLVDQAQEVSDEGIDNDRRPRSAERPIEKPAKRPK
jgi:N utilization substance protein A